LISHRERGSLSVLAARVFFMVDPDRRLDVGNHL
jgi:hypothetical protein